MLLAPSRAHPLLNCRVGRCHRPPTLTRVLFEPLICQSRKQQSVLGGWDLPGRDAVLAALGLRAEGRGATSPLWEWRGAASSPPFMPAPESELQNGGRQPARSGLFAFLCLFPLIKQYITSELRGDNWSHLSHLQPGREGEGSSAQRLVTRHGGAS